MDKLEHHTERVTQAVQTLDLAYKHFENAKQQQEQAKSKYESGWGKGLAILKLIGICIVPLITPILMIVFILVVIKSTGDGRTIEALGVTVSSAKCSDQAAPIANPQTDNQSPSDTEQKTQP